MRGQFFFDKAGRSVGLLRRKARLSIIGEPRMGAGLADLRTLFTGRDYPTSHMATLCTTAFFTIPITSVPSVIFSSLLLHAQVC